MRLDRPLTPLPSGDDNKRELVHPDGFESVRFASVVFDKE